jgi:hypothetical protein
MLLKAQWVTVPKARDCLHARIDEYLSPLWKVLGPGPLRRARNTAKGGIWHPSTTDIVYSSPNLVLGTVTQ